MTPHTWDPAESDRAVSCPCGHEALAHYDEHGPGCVGGDFCVCSPAPTIGCASCDCGMPRVGERAAFMVARVSGGEG